MLKGRARRRRRGIGLAEAALATVISALSVAVMLALVDRLARSAGVQAEARVVSAAADGASAIAAADIDARITDARTTAGDARLVPRAEVEGGLPPDFPTVTPTGRTLNWAHFGPNPDTLVIIAWATGALPWTAAPVSGGGISRVGRVGDGQAGCVANRFCGPGLDWDATVLLTALGAAGPQAGDMVALRDHSLARFDPALLWRADGPDAFNRMETDLAVTGAIVNASEVTGTADANTAELSVAGDVQATTFDADVSLEAAGNLVVTGGNLTSTTGISGFGEISAAAGGNFIRINSPEAQLNIQGAAALGVLEVRAVAGRAVAGIEEIGQVRAAAVAATGADVTRARANQLTVSGAAAAVSADFDDLVLGSRIEADRMQVGGQLYVGSCTGC